MMVRKAIQGRMGLPDKNDEREKSGYQGPHGSDGQFPPGYEKKFQEMEKAIEYLGRGWRTIGQHRLWFSETTMNFHEGEKLCKSKGGRLAAKSMRDATTRKFVFEIVNDKNHHSWIGLDDINVEGKFVWSDNVIFTQNDLWNTGGQPNGGRNQNCARIDASYNKIGDSACSTDQYIVCEIDAL